MKYRQTKTITLELEGNVPLLGYPIEWMIEQGHGPKVREKLNTLLESGEGEWSGSIGTANLTIKIQTDVQNL
jgi:hypothetical protein